MAGDPADVGGAPVDVFFFEIEDPFGGEVGADGISAGGVHDAFRLAGGARGVEDVERMFGSRAARRGSRRRPWPSARATSDRGPAFMLMAVPVRL